MKASFVIAALSLALSVSAAPSPQRFGIQQGRQNNGRQNNGRQNNGFGGNNNKGNANKGNANNNKGNANTKGNANANNNNNKGNANANTGKTGAAAANNNNNNANTGKTGAAAGGVLAGGATGLGSGKGINVNATAANNAAAANDTSVGGNDQDPQTSFTLNPAVVASGFANDGQDVPAAGQVPSLTSTNNFINFCLTVPNLPITNGKQITTGSCNPAPMGSIPSTDNMPSSKFTNPKNGDTIASNTPFTITMAISNLVTGNFVNAQENYFSAPQQLNAQGQILGHSHVVVEQLSALDQTTPTDPKKFAFFKGLNGAAVGGVLSADVTAGLPAGVYKLSSINTAANHQPALVPIAQHGSLDDAVYFTVADGGAAAAGAAAGTAAGTGAAAGAATGAAGAAAGTGAAAGAATGAAGAAAGKGAATGAAAGAAASAAAGKGAAAGAATGKAGATPAKGAAPVLAAGGKNNTPAKAAPLPAKVPTKGVPAKAAPVPAKNNNNNNKGNNNNNNNKNRL